eukprot:c17925_g2_i3.p1 GENE.c17925_g2_i3~~c17925_g2_i3.p1  ORF type:complete len:470 (+),score=112.24 c17925_g2_i3:31-1410(+)
MEGLDNIILLSDSYKITHFKQYPPGTEHVYSYFESRGGLWSETCFFGLQYLIKKYLVGQVVTKEKIDEAESYFAPHIPGFTFNRAGWEYILEKYDGRLPVRIQAVPEGSSIPTRNVLLTVENTDPNCFWLTNYLETLLVQVWYPMTVCTNSREQKRIIMKYLEETGDPTLINFKLHDFGFRGVSSVETSGLGGAAHLVNFMGTDTMSALVIARRYYGEECAGFSIPASEHSTITSWGREHEVDAMRNMLNQYPTGLVACVSDSYNIFAACSELWGKQLKDQIMSRDGTLVVRPDSGDPETMVLDVVARLGKAFGFTVNDKGYKVLDGHVRVIQGDGVDYQSLQEILEALKQNGWSADNIAFGSGGALLQKLNRDTQKCAFKCSCITINGKDQDVYKDPITDAGKKSKLGRLSLIRHSNGRYETVHGGNVEGDLLVTVFENGELKLDQKFTDIRNRANQF